MEQIKPENKNVYIYIYIYNIYIYININMTKCQYQQCKRVLNTRVEQIATAETEIEMTALSTVTA